MPGKGIYFDNAATTPVRPEVFEVMEPFLTESFGNPSGLYDCARAARKAVEEARRQVAKVINANPDEIFFTSGGTESDNWAIKGVAEAAAKSGKNHLIASSIEHHAVLHTCGHMRKKGYEVAYLPVDGEGFVDPATVGETIKPTTALVSVMLANNETGVVEPLSAIGEITRKRGVLLHTDAVQAAGHIPVDVNELGVDLLTVSAHKFYGPKGVGALYVRKGTKIEPLLHGGAQESNRRAGTENVAAIVGMGRALVLAAEGMRDESERVSALRDRLIEGVFKLIPHVRLNGPVKCRLPGNANFSFAFVEGESMLLHLDMQGCRASSGSACSSGSLDPSHVLIAMGVSHERAHGSIRFTLGQDNVEAEVDRLLEILPPIVAKLREMSPLYADFLKTGAGLI